MNSPEIIVKIDRDRAQRLGISTAQIGLEIRTALYGKEISKLKQDEDEYPIMLRYEKVTRDNINALVNLQITYRDMNTGICAAYLCQPLQASIILRHTPELNVWTRNVLSPFIRMCFQDIRLTTSCQ